MFLFLMGCNNSNIDFKAVKVFDGQYNVALETNDTNKIEALKAMFNQKVEETGLAPNFKYLIELKTDDGIERWRYSSDGYLMKYSQEDHRIFAVIDNIKFNQLAKIEKSRKLSRF